MRAGYPEDSVQSYIGDWWVPAAGGVATRGRLIHAFIPFVGQELLQLIPEGRPDPLDHTRANYRIAPLRIGAVRNAPRLPVAALPERSGEVRTVQYGKIRPAIVLSAGGPDVPAGLRRGASRWQSAPTLLVAPVFGVDRDGTRAGWRPEFVERIRRCEYPQYLWDQLPIGGPSESVIRLDHLQPVGNHTNSFTLSPYCLSEGALSLLDEWFDWLTIGQLPADGNLLEIRRALLEPGPER